MNIEVERQDLHVAVIPEVMVEFATVDDLEDNEKPGEGELATALSVSPPTSRSTDGPPRALALALASAATSGPIGRNDDDDNDGPSPMDKDEFAYPTNLGIETAETSKNLDIPNISGKDIYSDHNNGGLPNAEDRGHFRRNNFSSGSDLVQVSVEDLLISEEQNRTIKASKSRGRQHMPKGAGGSQQQQQQQQQLEPLVRPTSTSLSNSSNTNPITTTIITATIRTTGGKTRSIHFDDEQDVETKSPNPTQRTDMEQNQDAQKLMAAPQPQQQQQRAQQTRRISHPPEPKILTPAQQREAEVDGYIQKAIELHENNQLEEATKYFGLAARYENPLGQLMFGLSLRHGWGCKPDPKEAIIYLQRAAEYAMGELNELNPASASSSSSPLPPPPPSAPATATTGLTEKRPPTPDGAPQPHLQDQFSPKSTSSSSLTEKQGQHEYNTEISTTTTAGASHQNLRRMGSMDRMEAMATARKELVMALYELGMSYLKGWGVSKDKAVAFTYFKIAADLGDADAQNETALCYYEGIGVDKDMYESARYYRMASAQGASQLGNSWIWKPKYDQYCAAENAGIAVGTSSPAPKKDRSKKLAAAISTAIHGGSRSSISSSTISPPTSPSIPSPHYSISSIASGLASVTAATVGTGAVVPQKHSSTIRQSLISPPVSPPFGAVATSQPQQQRHSLSASVVSLSPTTPTSPASFTSSVASVPMSPSTSITAAAASSPLSSPLSPTPGSVEPVEKKKSRWSIWGTQRSTSTVVTSH